MLLKCMFAFAHHSLYAHHTTLQGDACPPAVCLCVVIETTVLFPPDGRDGHRHRRTHAVHHEHTRVEPTLAVPLAEPAGQHARPVLQHERPGGLCACRRAPGAGQPLRHAVDALAGGARPAHRCAGHDPAHHAVVGAAGARRGQCVTHEDSARFFAVHDAITAPG